MLLLSRSALFGSIRTSFPISALLTALTTLLLLALPLAAGAATITSTATPFTGDDLSVTLDISDDGGSGDLIITLTVDPGGNIGDLRGLFFHVSDESLLAGLTVVGDDITSSMSSANNVIDLGRGSNLNGGGSPCPCDFGVEIGSPGIGKDDIQSITFRLGHTGTSLDLSFLAGQDFGVRATSVGLVDGGRDGSSKLTGSVVPEPSTAILMLLGLAGLTSVKRIPA